MLNCEIQVLSSLLTPPDGKQPAPPVETRIQSLPVGELTWENFERLCYRLVEQQSEVEHCARYGEAGEAQEGIDLFARLSSGRYHCWQAKKHNKFGAAKLRAAVDLFLSGGWAEKTDQFTLAVQAPLQSTSVQSEIERQTKRCRNRGIVFVAIDGERLSNRLRNLPLLVDDFFGRACVEAFLGENVARKLGTRLDGGEFARAREQLSSIYQIQFHTFDPGGFGSTSEVSGTPPLTLLERFEVPDVIVRERQDAIVEGTHTANERLAEDNVSPNSREGVLAETARSKSAEGHGRLRRISAKDWVQRGERLVLLGDAGSGKSTMLRVTALEILTQGEVASRVAPHWKSLLPIYIPFSRWASQVEKKDHAVGLRDIVRCNLQPYMTAPLVELIDRAIDEKRILLLIDGLDEWGNEQSARATLSGLVTIVETHGLSAVVTGRPRGTDKIGAIPEGWVRGTIAPLSNNQQLAIASRWFSRHAPGRSTGMQATIAASRTEQFSSEIARDSNLSIIATVPLLLIGLIILALRGQILPRTRREIYNQLVKILLELHPASRATAAGDTKSRFRYSDDPEQRRAAIARLAFHLRCEEGGGSLAKSEAKKVLTEFLADQDGYALTPVNASAAAREILAVNAETQGLIIEKAQDEFGFVHASFEEYLCAEYLGGLPLDKIEDFVREKAGDGRWRNVTVHLLGGLSRRNEIDKLIQIIECAEGDEGEYSQYHRDRLLDDASIAIVSKAPQTAKRLTDATLRRIEMGDWMPARRSALASLLACHADPVLSETIISHTEQWLPARVSYRAPLIEALGNWEASHELGEVLWRAMLDEDQSVQRSAAAAFARCFGGQNSARDKLLEGLAKTRDLGNAAAFLECLAVGWEHDISLKPLYEVATSYHNGDLQIVGILGLTQLGQRSQELSDILLRSTNFWSDLSYPYRELAAALLIKYWNDSEPLIESALRHFQNQYSSPWDYDVAIQFLLGTSTVRTDVRDWIIDQLREKFPFNTFHGYGVWAQVGRFAKADADIRAAANAYWCDPERHLIDMHKARGYVSRVADPEVAKAFTQALAERKNRDRYWTVAALLDGWGRDHPDVEVALTALKEQPDETLYDVAAHLPALMQDNGLARERLLSMSENPELRRDMLARGLEVAGCDGSDEDAVSAILAFPSYHGKIFDPAPVLFSAFQSNSHVRELAKQRLFERDAPISDIARGYSDDAEFRKIVLAAAVPPPVELRAQCIEAASQAVKRSPLTAALSQSLQETDGELRVQMTIAHCERADPSDHNALEHELLEAAAAIGPNHDEVRAAALAGLATIQRLDALAALTERDKPVRLSTAGISQNIVTIERLICEQLSSFEAAFGDDLQERICSFNPQRFVELLCAAPKASSTARRTFLKFAENGELPKSPRAMHALAEVKPGSELLLDTCLDALSTGEFNNGKALANAEIGAILRDNFPEDERVYARLVRQEGFGSFVVNTIALAVYDPSHPALPNFPLSDNTWREFGAWALGATIAARNFDTDNFCRFTDDMVSRVSRTQFDAQQIANRAVIDRLREDEMAVAKFEERISSEVSASVAGSSARYLVAAGRLELEGRRRIVSLLEKAQNGQQLPIPGYDAIADKWRALRATLLAALAGAAEV